MGSLRESAGKSLFYGVEDPLRLERLHDEVLDAQ